MELHQPDYSPGESAVGCLALCRCEEHFTVIRFVHEARSCWAAVAATETEALPGRQDQANRSEESQLSPPGPGRVLFGGESTGRPMGTIRSPRPVNRGAAAHPRGRAPLRGHARVVFQASTGKNET